MTPLHEWVLDNWVEDGPHYSPELEKLYFREAGWSQVRFMRDTFAHRFGDVSVLSTHRSKSLELPVYHVQGNGWKMVARENFYGWVVSVKSIIHVNGLINKLRAIPDFRGWAETDSHDRMKQDTPARQGDWPVGVFAPYYAEGFPIEWCFEPYGVKPFQFTERLSTNHDVYMLAAILKDAGR